MREISVGCLGSNAVAHEIGCQRRPWQRAAQFLMIKKGIIENCVFSKKSRKKGVLQAALAQSLCRRRLLKKLQAAPREAARQPAAQGSQRREAASGAISSRRRKLQPPAATGAAAQSPPLDKDQMRGAIVKSEWESSLFGASVGSPWDPLGRKLSDVTAGDEFRLLGDRVGVNQRV